VVLIALVSVLAQALLAHGERELARRAAQPVSSGPRYSFQLTAVAAVAPDDIWAFGARSDNVALPIREPQPTPTAGGSCRACAIILHYNGRTWTRVPVDASLTATDSQPVMTSVSMVSASEGWAVGSQTTSDPSTNVYTEAPLLLRSARGAWTPVAAPALPADFQIVRLNGVAALPSGEAWAVGEAYSATGQVDLALHYSQGRWQVTKTGLSSPLAGVSAVGPGEAWATGSENPGTGPGLILHYTGGTWTRVASPTPNILHAIAMRTATDGWIGGDGAATLHYDGASWTQTGLVLHGFEIDGIAAASPTEAWAIGGYRFANNPNDTTTLLHYGNGRWSPYPLPLDG
jgi:hypothetical protein